MKITVTKDQAIKFLLQKQLFTEKALKGNKGIAHVFNKLRVIQYDPLNPCGRNPDLVLQSRIQDYHPEDYYIWLYKNKNGIECYDKSLCIIPIEDFPLTSHNRKKVGEWSDFKKLLKERKEDFEALLQFIDKNGPISTRDIENQEIIPGMGWYGYGSRWGKVALELLWKTGRIVIAKRVNGTKYYDLPHKLFAEDYFGIDKAVEEEHIMRRIRSVGIMRERGSTDAWQGLGKSAHIHSLIKDLINKEELAQINIDGVNTKYVAAIEDVPLFSKKVKLLPQMKFIAPLDTLIWDRNMIEELFGFRYRWEVYVPLAKREYGYYVLPILYKDKFVGRIEPILQNETLVIKNIWKEPGIKWTSDMDKILIDAIDVFKNYLNAKETVFYN